MKHNHRFGEMRWKVNTVQLLREMVECNNGMGIFKQPVNIFGRVLADVATRAAQLNDPIMNALMCELALYEIADGYSAQRDDKAVQEVYDAANKQYFLENPPKRRGNKKAPPTDQGVGLIE